VLVAALSVVVTVAVIEAAGALAFPALSFWPADQLKKFETIGDSICIAGAAHGERGTREDWQRSKTGSKRAAISGYGGRRTAIKAPGRATSSHLAKQ
jgi:hypothetical protein